LKAGSQRWGLFWSIFGAASTRVNVRIFYQPLTPPAGLGLSGVAPRRDFSVGQRAARSLPERWPADLRGGRSISVSRPSTRAYLGKNWPWSAAYDRLEAKPNL
jgi:hypothetical protein